MADNPVHETALAAEGAVEKLATQLGEAGAPPETIKGITQMADVLRQVVAAVGAPDPEAGDGMDPSTPAPAEADANPVGAVADEMA